MILRVDGTTAGGPILDTQNQHRASGGTWKFFEAEWIGDQNDDQNGSERRNTRTRLRIRLVIPPEKQQVLVMEGEVRRGPLSSVYSIAQENMNQLRSSGSFGMSPDTAESESSRKSEELEGDVLLQCSGEAWVEDRYGKRSKLGPFSLLKMQDRSADDYTYTIPAPKRYQD